MKKKIMVIILLIAMFVVPMSSALATDGYFNANDNVNDTRSYNHNAFIAGRNVKANSEVDGLAFFAGSTVEANAKVEYGFIAGDTLEVNSIVEKDLFIAGNSIKIGKEAVIGRDAYIAGNKISLYSNINGNAFVAGSIVTLDNVTINGDLNVAAAQLDIVDNVKINGKLIINEDAIINNDSKLSYFAKETYKSPNLDFSFKNVVSEVILSLLTLLFAAILLIVLFPKMLGKINCDITGKQFGKRLLYGLATLIVVPIVGVLSIAIIVGMTLSVLIFALYIIALIIATILAAYVLGDWVYTKLLKQKQNYVISTSLAIIVIKIAEYIPYIGWAIALVVFLYGLGIVCELFLNRNK